MILQNEVDNNRNKPKVTILEKQLNKDIQPVTQHEQIAQSVNLSKQLEKNQVRQKLQKQLKKYFENAQNEINRRKNVINVDPY